MVKQALQHYIGNRPQARLQVRGMDKKADPAPTRSIKSSSKKKAANKAKAKGKASKKKRSTRKRL